MADGFFKTYGANLGALSADPSNPVTGDTYFNTTTNQLKTYNGTAWVAVGTAGFGSGVNFVTNPTADSTDGFTTYDDGATATPVDGTGGSPATLTFTRNTSSPIHGTADFKLSKSASDGQGEGLAYTFTAGTGFPAGTKCLYTFWSKGSANFVTGTASDLRLYLYDVTNSALITPTRTSILVNGYNVTSFQLTSGTSYRALFHVATTSALAWDFQFKFLFVGPGTQLAGPAFGDMQLYPGFTYGGLGTVSNNEARTKRTGDSWSVKALVTAGTTAASTAKIILPTGITIDSTKLTSQTNAQIVGLYWLSDATANNPIYSTTTDPAGVVFYDGSDTSALYFTYLQGGTSNQFNKTNANAFIATGSLIAFSFEIPITGFTAEAAVSQSGVIRMSEIMASGTRVTATPTVLGEWRSRIRDASARTYTDTAPGTSPTAANGIAIYKGNTWQTADSANSPTLYDIFIGKNKSFRVKYYSTTGRTGYVDATVQFDEDGTTSDIGYAYDYDEVTGIFTIGHNRTGTNGIDHSPGLNDPSNATVLITSANIYFEVFVADNDYQIQLASDLNQPVYIKDVKASGTDGGTFTSGAWQTRVLNTVENSQPWISLSSNQFTLQAGTYSIEASAPSNRTDNHKAKLYNITDASDTIIGTSELSPVGTSTTIRSFVIGTFIISSSKTFEIQHRCNTTEATDGFGVNSGFGVNEVYTQMKLIKLF